MQSARSIVRVGDTVRRTADGRRGSFAGSPTNVSGPAPGAPTLGTAVATSSLSVPQPQFDHCHNFRIEVWEAIHNRRYRGGAVNHAVAMISTVAQMPISMKRAVADLRVRIDPYEHHRRSRIGLGAATNQRLLDVLMSLPLGMGVPVDALDAASRRVVRRAEIGLVNEDRGEFVRLVRRPVVLDSLLVTACSWQPAREAASGFAAYCERTVRLPSCQIDPLVTVEAEHLGVGVESTDGDIVVLPRPHVEMRFTSYGWWFSESIYEQWLSDHH